LRINHAPARRFHAARKWFRLNCREFDFRSTPQNPHSVSTNRLGLLSLLL